MADLPFSKKRRGFSSDAKSVTHRVCNVDSVSPSLLILQSLWPTSGWKDVAREASVHVLSQQCPLSHACYIYNQGKIVQCCMFPFFSWLMEGTNRSQD